MDAGDAGEQFSSMQHVNREGSYQLSHAYDRFIDTASFSRVKNRKNWVPASSDEGLWLRSKRQFYVGLINLVVFDELLFTISFQPDESVHRVYFYV